MSAYDNPTIIKNDAALIWGQAAGDFAESFTQSYAAAKKDREAKEKEAKLEAEKKAKEAKEQTLANQVFLSKSQYNDQVRIEKIDEDLVKAGVDVSGIDLYNKFAISTGEIIGQNELSLATVVQSKEDADKKRAYSSQVAATDKNLRSVMGGMYSDSEAIKSGKINATNIGKIRFNGDNLLTQAINRSTTMGNAFFDPKKTTRDLIYDVKGDPSDMTLLINNKIGTKDDVLKFFEATNPGATKDINGKRNDAFLEAEFQRGVKDGDIVESQKNKGEFEFRFKRKIDKNWDGTLYSEIPEIEYGKSAVTAGVYSKEGDNQINNKFIGKLTYENIVGNANINKNQGTVKYERQEVDMDNIILAMKPTLIAQAEGLIAGPLSNNNVADGVLAQLDYGTNYPSKKFAELTTPEKVEALVKVMSENEKQNIIAKSSLKPIKDDEGIERYYIMDEKNNQIFSNATNKSSGGSGKSKTAKPTFDEVSKQIYAVEAGGPMDDFQWGNKKVSFDGVNFVVNSAGPNKDMVFTTKEEVINYLKTGKIK